MKKLILIFTLMILPLVTGARVISVIVHEPGALVDALKTEEAMMADSLVVEGGVELSNEDLTAIKKLLVSYKLEYVDIYDTSNDYIGGEFFYGCERLVGFRFPKGLTTINYYAFEYCYKLENVYLPETLRSFGTGIFRECAIKKVLIPKNVSLIADQTFYYCPLQEIYCQAIDPPKCNVSAFSAGSSQITNVVVYVPSGTKSKYENADGWMYFTNIVELDPFIYEGSIYGVEIDGINYNLNNNRNTAEVTSKTTKYAGDITIPEYVEYEGKRYNVNSIVSGVFENCTEMRSISLPQNIKGIDKRMFNGCSSMISLTIPSNVTSIGESAFQGCSNLSSITIPSSVTSIGESAFQGCSNLASITIPNSVASIGSGAFSGCSSLTSVMIPKSVTSIENNTFEGCYGLTSVSIPYNITRIGGAAFFGCSGLSSIIIPNSVTSIGESAFEHCLGLSSVTIPNSVTTIEGYAFYNCSGLEKIIVGTCVKTIYSHAFSNCKKLTDLYCYAENVPIMQSYWNNTPCNDVFEDSNIEYATLHVPAASIDAYKSTAPWSNFKEIVAILDNPVAAFTLTYMVDGKEYRTYTVEEGASITPEAAPTKKGYTFSGWSEIPETMPDHDVTVTGTFERHFNVGHVVNVINFIMNENATADDVELYDMNNDGELNIGDVILIVRAILNDSGSHPNLARRLSAETADLTQYTAAQFEVKVAENTSIKGIRLVKSMTQTHLLMCQKKDANTYAVVVYSLSNQLMNPEDNHIVEIETDSGDSNDLSIANVIVSKPNGESEGYLPQPVATAIQQIGNEDGTAVVYDLKGNRLHGNKGLAKGIYIVNGKKTVVR